ncbi:hypothetical protein RRG08_034328 [Elysia crispata]|uniref:Uncharacterized protein n=1 Tax=Elysia crispata TaxID=231223 RepID=A0AAE1AI28_9GAST|nr:hypothetical protein RRG08_034328 [Elysia crispata]
MTATANVGIPNKYRKHLRGHLKITNRGLMTSTLPTTSTHTTRTSPTGESTNIKLVLGTTWGLYRRRPRPGLDRQKRTALLILRQNAGHRRYRHPLMLRLDTTCAGFIQATLRPKLRLSRPPQSGLLNCVNDGYFFASLEAKAVRDTKSGTKKFIKVKLDFLLSVEF